MSAASTSPTAAPHPIQNNNQHDKEHTTIIRPIDHSTNSSSVRPILFLDIDGVLNTKKHNIQIYFSQPHVQRLKRILDKTRARIVLTTFWRHFHEYIRYVLQRHGVDVGGRDGGGGCILYLPERVTPWKRMMNDSLEGDRSKQQKQLRQHHQEEQVERSEYKTNNILGRSAQDEAESSSRAEEIEAWLRMYGEKYLGGHHDDNGEGSSGESTSTRDGEDGERDSTTATNAMDQMDATDAMTASLSTTTTAAAAAAAPTASTTSTTSTTTSTKSTTTSVTSEIPPGYEFHPLHWKYVILDNRPRAAKPNSPLHDRFVLTDTKLGLTEEDADLVIELLLFGPKNCRSRSRNS